MSLGLVLLSVVLLSVVLFLIYLSLRYKHSALSLWINKKSNITTKDLIDFGNHLLITYSNGSVVDDSDIRFINYKFNEKGFTPNEKDLIDFGNYLLRTYNTETKVSDLDLIDFFGERYECGYIIK